MSLTHDSRIIFVHGLAAKPAEDRLTQLWTHALVSNIGMDHAGLATAMSGNTDLFRSGYWANAVPDHIEDTTAVTNKLADRVDAVIAARKFAGVELHISKAGWLKAKMKKFGLGIVNTLATALTVKDDAIRNHVREVRLYNGDQYIADRMRAPLETQLRDAWDNGKRVVILSHSMGTFISYDVLWRFSHRAEPQYRKYRNKAVDLLITMGSPLGDRALRQFMLVDRWKEAPTSKKLTKVEKRRFYPTNIDSWFNYSAWGDVVCHDGTLNDDFFEGMKQHIGGFGRQRLRDYVKLYNPYINGKGKHNPHKSYGYLVQPKLSQKLQQFFGVG